MTTKPESAAAASAPDLASPTPEERLRQRVSMLTQLLIVAAIVVVMQFGIMLKVLIDTSK
jgi:hypothetical protein